MDSAYGALVTAQLNSIERGARAILKAIDWPTDPVEIWERLADPDTTADTQSRRNKARLAMFALLNVRDTRNHLRGRSADPARVAHTALVTGQLAAALGLKVARDRTNQVNAQKPRRPDDSVELREAVTRLLQRETSSSRMAKRLAPRFARPWTDHRDRQNALDGLRKKIDRVRKKSGR